GHAWNAIRLGERWYLADPTWGAGYVNDYTFHKEYNASYFMTPPEVFVTNHMPSDPRWQLLETPLTAGEFLRKPNLRPGFAALDLELVAPDRARTRIDAGQTLSITLRNPHGFAVQGSVRALGSDAEVDRCIANAAGTELSCRLSAPGRHRV